MTELGRTLLIIGLVVAAVGAVMWLLGLFFPGFRLGRLPGDIAIERPGLRVYIPLATMLLVSLLLSALAWLFRR